ncbi:MAG: hypothetical protein HY791_38515 [Deltaproteobacteria bacterium]|nr:hypothetical protein [Deltaproteobacteria bacterium]
MRIFRAIMTAGVASVVVLAAAPALASCRIHNDTKWDFTIESGNTSNQRVGPHTTTSIAAGKIIAKSKEGKSFGGMCKDGDELEVKEEKDIPVLEIKKK